MHDVCVIYSCHVFKFYIKSVNYDIILQIKQKIFFDSSAVRPLHFFLKSSST